MTRSLVVALALGVAGYLAYRTMYGTHAEAGAPVEAPTDKLQGAHQAADRIERLQNERANDAQKAADTERQ